MGDELKLASPKKFVLMLKNTSMGVQLAITIGHLSVHKKLVLVMYIKAEYSSIQIEINHGLSAVEGPAYVGEDVQLKLPMVTQPQKELMVMKKCIVGLGLVDVAGRGDDQEDVTAYHGHSGQVTHFR